MLRVLLSMARAGMALAMPIYHPKRPGTILLRAGVKLDDVSIAKLREMRIRDVWVRYPKLEFMEEYINPAVLEATQQLARQTADALDRAAASQHAKLEFPAYRDAILALLDHLAQHPRCVVFLNELADADAPLLRHASNVCLISILMGVKLDFYLVRERVRLSSLVARDVSSLGVGAMLADIGMLRLDEQTLRRWNLTRDENDKAWQKHTELGARMVRGQIEPSAAAVVLHHHQKFDGSGFPPTNSRDGHATAPVGSDIHVFARIVGAADLFARLRHPAHAPLSSEEDAPSVPAVRALGRMLEHPCRYWVDPIVMRALFSVVPPYPPGTLVRLSDGARAVVVDWTTDDPCRPTVYTLGEDDDPRFAGRDGEKIDLTMRPGLTIVEADGEPVGDDNFSPSRPGEFDLSEVSITMAAHADPDAPPLPKRKKPRRPGKAEESGDGQ